MDRPYQTVIYSGVLGLLIIYLTTVHRMTYELIGRTAWIQPIVYLIMMYNMMKVSFRDPGIILKRHLQSNNQLVDDEQPIL